MLNLNGKKEKEKEEFAHRQDVHSNQLVWKYLEKRTLKLSVVSYLCVDDVLMQGLRSLFLIYRFLSICIICFSHKEIKGKKKQQKPVSSENLKCLLQSLVILDSLRK